MRVRTRPFYSQLISSNYVAAKLQIVNAIKSVDFVCTTADCWSKRRRSYLGVTAHWLKTDLDRVSVCLGITRIVGQHTYDVLAKRLEAVHHSFGLTRANLTETITDSGSNFIKAFQVFDLKDVKSNRLGFLFTDLLHAWIKNFHFSRAGLHKCPPRKRPKTTKQKTAEEILCQLEEESDQCDSESSGNSNNTSSNEETDSECDNSHSDSDYRLDVAQRRVDTVKDDSNEYAALKSGEDDVDSSMNVTFVDLTDLLNRSTGSHGIYSLPTHRRCAAHFMNLIATADLKKIKDLVFVTLYNSTFHKLRRIWNMQSHSTKASDYISQKLGRLFIVPNTTRYRSLLFYLLKELSCGFVILYGCITYCRWNSFFNALYQVKTFLNSKEPARLHSVFRHLGVELLTTTEEDFIKEYAKIMVHLSDALDLLQGDWHFIL